jgi:ATP/maltotriose-dependent transcriptional regulator MalT
MEFLERDAELEAMDDALDEAAEGHGSVIVVAGEAGIGKTRLVNEFIDSAGDDVRVLWGACDDLVTPRVLGPVRDIAVQVGGPLEDLVSGSDRAGLYESLLEALDSGLRPTAAVFEDLHWADAATLDVIKYLGRRIGRISVVLIVTFREDEVAPGDPLHRVFGDLPSSSVRRLNLQALSRSAVDLLAPERDGSTSDLYQLTGGNPFLVTELVTFEDRVPRSVLDAIASRMARLSDDARQVVEQVAVVPGRCKRHFLESMPVNLETALDEGRDRGLIEFDDVAAWFRHEIARRAAEKAIPASTLRGLNGALVGHLVAEGADAGRIVHHAQQAGDVEVLVEYGPLAARHARTASAHREAASHFRRVVPHLSRLPEAEQAQILLEYAIECYTTDEQRDSLEAAERSLALFRKLGDRKNDGVALRWLSRIRWWRGDRAGAEEAGEAAVGVLEEREPDANLAMAYSNLSQLHMLAHDLEPAMRWAEQAISTARAVDDPAAESHALNNLGSALVRSGDASGRALLIESLELSLREGLDEHAVRAYSNFIWVALDNREYALAAGYLEDGLKYALETENHGSYNYMMAERARLHFEIGEWSEAEEDARWVLEQPQAPGITTLPALIVLARCQVRRGDPDAGQTVAGAWDPARASDELQRIGPAALAKVEHAWLQRAYDEASRAIETAYRLALASPQPWVTDEIAFWMWRAGGDISDYVFLTDPYRLQIDGDWKAAAEVWDELGCPYESACALADASDPEALLEALARFDRLGAAPAGALLRSRLRKMRVQGIPRGPRAATRANPAGLTNRQIDVVRLVSEGLSNAEIADRLLVSPKTVDHHVSAILAKLDVPSRGEAGEKAVALGVIER